MRDEAQEQMDHVADAAGNDGQTAPAEGAPVEGAPTEPAVEELPPANVADLEAEIERLRAEAATNLDGWQRALAEFANYKRRNDAERSQLAFLTGVKIIEKLLPIIDDFDRALANLPDDIKNNGWIEGVSLTRRKLVSLLENEGVSPIPIAPGDAFDPALHEAITHEESDQFGEGQIIAELQKGYRIGDRVLRPARVRVAR